MTCSLDANLSLICVVFTLLCVSPVGSRLCGVSDPEKVKHFDVRLPERDVPGGLTTYMCQHVEARYQFSNPEQETYTVLGFEPLVGQNNVTHHMILFGCDDHATDPSPHTCTAADNQCRRWLVQWSVGMAGPVCTSPQAGFQIGPGSSIKSFLLQIHWNNAGHTEGLTDTSGIRVFYARGSKQFEQGNLQIGQNDLEIPEGHTGSGHEVRGGCSGACTAHWMTTPIWLTRVHLHLHAAGSGGVLQVVRGGAVVTTVLDTRTYDYRSPTTLDLDTPIEVKPGDEMRLICRYDNRENSTLFWGEGTNGEMCYAFISYYPRVAGFDQCIQFDNYDICSDTGFAVLGECVFAGFVRAFNSGMAEEVLRQCEGEGQHVALNVNPTSTDSRQGRRRGAGHVCSPECDVAVTDLTSHPCMQGRLGKETMRVYLRDAVLWPRVSAVLDLVQKSCRD